MAAKRPDPVPRISAWWLVAGAALLGLAGVEAYVWWPASKPIEPPPAASAPLPPLTESPFLNTKAGVAYVGDDRCVGCHRDYVRSYHQHPMGRSLYTAADSPTLEHYGPSANDPFQSGTFHFQAVKQGPKLIHKEWCEDAQGKVVAQTEAEIAYVIGSGAQARSFVVQHDGFLFESPLTWFTHKAEWHLSPGYESHQMHFNRPIELTCLYCHCQETHKVEGTVNEYRDPVFGQLAIGCERCHGPGELHVARRREGPPAGAVDDTIVNPRHLAPVLREEICEQCHLQGEDIIVRRGRARTDYRPGLPLHEYVTVMVRPPELTDAAKIVSHVEQMHLSVCFQKSAGHFGCISCHDAHGESATDQKIDFYRQRCLNCHSATPGPAGRGPGIEAPECPVPRAERLAKDARDNCLTCHMPRNPSSNVTHFAVTDHRVIRLTGRPAQNRPGAAPGAVPVVAFHKDQFPPGDEEMQRDLGVVLANMSSRAHEAGAIAIRDFLSRQALPLVNRAVERAPNDVPALVSRGFAMFALDRRDDDLKMFEAALALAPDREETLIWAAGIAEAQGRLDLAETYCERLVKNDPYRADNQHLLAVVRIKQQAWPQALQAAQASLRIDPFRAESRALLITALIETGDRARAQTEFDVLGVIHPEYQQRLRPWFAQRIGQGK